MRENRPSTTAAVVAWARAASGLDDDVTARLIPRAYTRSLAASSPGRLGAFMSTVARRAISAGLVDHMRLRTATIDALMLQGIQQGNRQLVVVGAGLDARPYRFDELADVVAFEIDHPASQAYKRRKAAQLPARCRDIRYVAVDFEQESMGDRLVECGFDPTIPTFWIWEGVTMYLAREATEATLATISSLSAPDSRLAMTYMLPEPIGLTRGNRIVHRVFATISEPLVGGMRPADVRAMLRRHGFGLMADGSNTDWQREMGGEGAGWAMLFRAERLAFAAKL